jgi:hypothetical protein
MDSTGTLGPTPRIPGATQRQNPFFRLSAALNTVTDTARDRLRTAQVSRRKARRAAAKNGTDIQYSDARGGVRNSATMSCHGASVCAHRRARSHCGIPCSQWRRVSDAADERAQRSPKRATSTCGSVPGARGPTDVSVR